MKSSYLSSPSNPHKRSRLSSSPHRSPSTRKPFYSPSFATLAHDRYASRAKLQSTWEDIIQKYSGIPSSEADEIDLETEEIVVDNGHLKSLQDSALWDPLDSEREDTDDIVSERNDDAIEYTIPNETPQLPKMPSEDEIMRQFGEEFGREILAYLQNRTSLSSKSEKSQLWSGPENEEAIFARAKELWKQFRMKRPSFGGPSRTFNKASFERAVFGSISTQTAFEKAVFGHWKGSNEWTDDEGYGEEADGIGSGRKSSSRLDRTPESKERRVATPRRGIRTPSSNVGTPSSRGRSATAKDKSRGIVISGLIIDASDEEDDFFQSTQSPCVRGKTKAPETPQKPEERGATTSPLTSKRSNVVHTVDDDHDLLISQDEFDTTGKCGDVGYRCAKAFCFKCV